jgi:hypothetical protein
MRMLMKRRKRKMRKNEIFIAQSCGPGVRRYIIFFMLEPEPKFI